MCSRGLPPTPDAVRFLAERVEGNLLAAVQEMDKLELLRGLGPVDVDAVREAVSDSARFDVFQLADAAVAGRADRALRILDGLWAEGVAAPLIVWVLARELRVLNRLAWEMEHGKTLEAAMAAARIWQQRKPVLAAALKRCNAREWRGLLMRAAAVERVVKGVQRGNVLEQLTGLVADLAGVRGARLQLAC